MYKCRNTGCENQTVEKWHDYCERCLDGRCGACGKQWAGSNRGWSGIQIGNRRYMGCSEDHWNQVRAENPGIDKAMAPEALPGPGRVMLHPDQVAALASWARAEEEGGVSGWGPRFDAAMKVAKEVTRA